MIRQIGPEQLAEMLRKDEPVYLVDVREPWEYEYCHLAESVLIPLAELPSRKDEVEPPEGAQIVVYCHHGIRSLSGASILQQAGFDKVSSLAGGIEAWSVLIDPTMPRY